MSLELLSTFASIGTFIVIGATAIAAVVQLRHLRANNELTGLLNVLSRVEDPEFSANVDKAKLALRRLDDRDYRERVSRGEFEREGNPWLTICQSYEWVGSLVKHKLIPEAPFMDVYSLRILVAYELMEPVLALVRRRGDPSIWENFEYLIVRAMEWERKHPGGLYPPQTPRLHFRDRYAAADGLPASSSAKVEN